MRTCKHKHTSTELKEKNLNGTDTAARLLQTHLHLFPQKSTPYCKTHTEKSFSLSFHLPIFSSLACFNCPTLSPAALK